MASRKDVWVAVTISALSLDIRQVGEQGNHFVGLSKGSEDFWGGVDDRWPSFR